MSKNIGQRNSKESGIFFKGLNERLVKKSMHNCSKCPKKHSKDSELSTKETMHAIFSLFIVPFFLFLCSLGIMIYFFPTDEKRYLYAIATGFIVMFLYYKSIKCKEKR